MEDSDGLIDSIKSLAESQPDNLTLGLHLASLLRDADRVVEARAQCDRILARDPGNRDALQLVKTLPGTGGPLEGGNDHRQPSGPLGQDPSEDDGGMGGAESGEEESPAVRDNVVPLKVVAGGRSADGLDDDADGDAERPDITLADVGGMESVKRRLNLSFLAPLKNPELRKMFGKSLRGGLLLYGPPGCGKTFIARAPAGELGAKFISVGLTDVIDMWMGASERNLHEIFETARRNAPCVLFLDEIDALGQKRSHLKHSGLRLVVNTLLAELDGIDDKNEGVFVLAATNHPWDVDSALKRPGRLDRTLLVLPPDREARFAILTYHLRDKPTQDVDLAAIAKRSEGCSGADLSLLCEAATELAMEQAIETGDARPIGMTHFKTAMKSLRRSTGPWFETARNYALYANEGGAYDELLAYIRQN